MSNKRLKRTEAEFFVYEPGVVVPRDVSHLLVPSAVEVLPEGVFRDLRSLKELRLSEGLREIGGGAFYECRSLEHINFPATLIKIGSHSFHGTSLISLHFPEHSGLVEIGVGAFSACSSLTRISLPSTVTRIGGWAFEGCSSLVVMTLVDGLRKIGGNAFRVCALEDIFLPATLTEIGPGAFVYCKSLRRVKLSEGIQLINRSAFDACHSLDHVSVTLKCLVVTRGGNDYNFSFARDGSIPHTGSDRVVISSECFHSMRSAEVSALKIAITEILGTELNRGWNDKHERLCELLAEHERRRKEEVTTILELGLWKAEMCRSGGTTPGTRAACRVTCKAGGIIPNVVPFL